MPDREIARVRDGFIVRPPIERRARSPRSNRDEFVRAAAVALEVAVGEVDLSAPLRDHYGADELQVLECIQAAEDIWGARIAPDQFPVDQCPRLVGTFPTLASILHCAERATAG